MSILFFEYSKCQSCVKARKWLEAHKVKYKAIPIIEEPPTKTDIVKYAEKSGRGLRKMFNTSGVVYREMKLGEKADKMSDGEIATLLASNGKLIKRPILVDGDTVIVGFDEPKYKAHFK